MGIEPKNLAGWSDLLEQAVKDTLIPSMKTQEYTWDTTDIVSDPKRLAAFVALSSAGESIQVGFSGEPSDVASVVSQMFGFDDLEDAGDDYSEILDGLAEIINIVAGALHRSLSSDGNNLQLSIPLLIHGEIVIQGKEEWVAHRLTIGDNNIDAIIIRGLIQKQKD